MRGSAGLAGPDDRENSQVSEIGIGSLCRRRRCRPAPSETDLARWLTLRPETSFPSAMPDRKGPIWRSPKSGPSETLAVLVRPW